MPATADERGEKDRLKAERYIVWPCGTCSDSSSLAYTRAPIFRDAHRSTMASTRLNAAAFGLRVVEDFPVPALAPLLCVDCLEDAVLLPDAAAAAMPVDLLSISEAPDGTSRAPVTAAPSIRISTGTTCSQRRQNADGSRPRRTKKPRGFPPSCSVRLFPVSLKVLPDRVAATKEEADEEAEASDDTEDDGVDSVEELKCIRTLSTSWIEDRKRCNRNGPVCFSASIFRLSPLS